MVIDTPHIHAQAHTAKRQDTRGGGITGGVCMVAKCKMCACVLGRYTAPSDQRTRPESGNENAGRQQNDITNQTPKHEQRKHRTSNAAASDFLTKKREVTNPNKETT